MVVKPGRTVNLPGQTNTWAFVYVQSVGEQSEFTVGGDIYVVLPYPNCVPADLPFSGVPVPFVNKGPAALSICLLPPNVDPWWNCN
jgi:hypothetical protein